MSLFSQEYATKMMILEERQDAEAQAKAEERVRVETETAIKLLSRNLLPINEIAEFTDLPIERIKELADSLKQQRYTIINA